MSQDLTTVAEVLRAWGAKSDYIDAIYIYGSRARADYRDDSDLDVALIIRPGEHDTNAMAVFAFESDKWIEELQPNIPYKLHLKGCYGEDSPDVCAGVKDASLLVYRSGI